MSVTLKILNGDLITIVLEQGEMFDISKMISISNISKGDDVSNNWKNDFDEQILNSFYFLSEKLGRALTLSDILIDGDVLTMFVVPRVFTEIGQENMACFLKNDNKSRKIKMYEARFSYGTTVDDYITFFWDRQDCFFMDTVVTHKIKNRKYFVYPVSGFVTFRTFDEMIDSLDNINLACADQLKLDWNAGAITIFESLNYEDYEE